jgi:glycine betaine/choline ABC-type transport system substrate-binding protein
VRAGRGLLAAAALPAALAACAPGAGGTGPAGIVVGSKNFTEQVILGEILAALAEREGIPVTRRLNLGGTFICHQALKAGEIDLYVEYTGTALTAILRRPPVASRDEALRAVREAYAAELGLVWTEPLGFNNTFALVVSKEGAERHRLRTISDLARVQDVFRPGFGYEFVERADGYAGLAAAYGLSFARRPREMDLGLIYRALAEGEVDVVAGNSTDGVIASLGLVVLEDDRRYFPPYDAVPVVRGESLRRHPPLRGILAALGGAIPEDVMRRMNLAVDGDLRDPREAAREFVERLPRPGRARAAP